MILNENSDKYIQPDDININLKEHQLAMLHKSLNIEENNEFAIMKDKPGSGKTYVVLTMINELKKKDIKNKLPKKTNVIVVPQNIYFQWSYSIDRLTENLSYLKFVEYEHLLNLYSEPQTLYNKDIILVTSSYYNSLASTLTSLELNVDRLFIDEIDNVGNFINQSFNTKFIMFISASFSFNNNNGFFTNKLKDKSEEDITIICDEKFIDTQINLENPNIEVYLCKNLYIDKVLINIITQDELKNINACYYKLDDKNYNQIISTNCYLYALINGKHVYGFDLIIEAFYKLSEERKIQNTLLILVDPSNTTKEFVNGLLKQKAFQTNKVLLVTENLDFVSLIKKSDITIRATRTDGDSLSIRESLYYNVPIICSDVTTRPEGAVVFKNNNSDDLSDKILNTLKNKENFKYKHIDYGKQVLDVYDELIGV